MDIMSMRDFNINYLNRNIDLLLGILSLIIGVSILYLSVVLEKIHQEDLGSIVVFSSLIYIYFRKTIITDGIIHLHASNTIKKCNHILFIISILLSIWIAWNNLYYRPITFFVFFTIAVASVIFEIFYQDTTKASHIILSKIIILSILIRASVYYEFAGIYGVDTWTHNSVISTTANVGHIVESIPVRSNSYYGFPIYHIAGAMVQIVSSLRTYDGLFLSIGILGTLSCVFVYAIGKKIADEKVGLLAALVLNLSNYTIVWGINTIPMSLGFLFVTIILYIILCKEKLILNYRFLLIILSFSLILTHTIASFILNLTLILFAVVNQSYHIIENNKVKNQMMSLGFAILFGVLMLTVWANNAPPGSMSFFDTVLRGFSNSLFNEAELIVDRPTDTAVEEIPYISAVLGHLSYYILLGIGMIGSLIWLNVKNRDLHKITLVSLVTMFIICIYSFTILSLNNILPDRWFSFMYIPLSIIGMRGLVNVANVFKNNITRILSITFVVVTIIFFMTTTPLVNTDNPLYSEEFAFRLGYTQSEIAAVNSLSQMHVRPATDLYYALTFPHLMDYNEYNNMSLSQSRVFILRDYNLRNSFYDYDYRTSIHNGSSYVDYVQHDRRVISDYFSEIGIDNKSLIYDNGNVNMYSI